MNKSNSNIPFDVYNASIADTKRLWGEINPAEADICERVIVFLGKVLETKLNASLAADGYEDTGCSACASWVHDLLITDEEGKFRCLCCGDRCAVIVTTAPPSFDCGFASSRDVAVSVTNVDGSVTPWGAPWRTVVVPFDHVEWQRDRYEDALYATHTFVVGVHVSSVWHMVVGDRIERPFCKG